MGTPSQKAEAVGGYRGGSIVVLLQELDPEVQSPALCKLLPPPEISLYLSAQVCCFVCLAMKQVPRSSSNTKCTPIRRGGAS